MVKKRAGGPRVSRENIGRAKGTFGGKKPPYSVDLFQKGEGCMCEGRGHDDEECPTITSDRRRVIGAPLFAEVRCVGAGASGLPDRSRPFTVLGIETSCDDTGVAVVRSDGTILGEALASQYDIHKDWGGVVPGR